MKISTAQELSTATEAINVLFAQAPGKALEAALAWVGRGSVRRDVWNVRAAMLIDAGAIVGNHDAVREGISTLRKLEREIPRNSVLSYNLANALTALAMLEDKGSPNWYVATADQRKEARRRYHDVTADQLSVDADVFERQSNAWANLGNELDSAFRWVEAYDCWVQALSVDPTNAVPALSIATMLQRRCRQFPQHPKILHSVADFYARFAKKYATGILRRSGPHAFEQVSSLKVGRSRWKPRHPHEHADPYTEFVAAHRLALDGTIEAVDFRRKRWDNLYFRGLSEGIDQVGVPPIFAMFNQLKSDFCTSRWLAFAAETMVAPGERTVHPIPKTGLYMDTLDYAVYGTGPSMLVLAQRSAIDILDRVAALANHYFEVGDKPVNVHFRNFWRERGGTGEWRSHFDPELATWNPGIIALGELALDLGEGSPLVSKSNTRNAATHRFCVLHDDMRARPSRPCPAVEHHDYLTFHTETIHALQLARAAILYLVDAVEHHEARLPRGHRLQTLAIPHHHVRGER